MKIEDVRRKNLAVLVSEYGTIAALAEAVDTTESYLSTILSGSRNAGSRIARKLEVATKHPDGWMDIDHFGNQVVTVEVANLPPDEAELLRRYRASSQKKKAVILALARL